jgi:site-specific DNA-methyltransferase (adenine-specific)
MEKAYSEGLVVQLKPGAVPQYRLYLDQSKGRTVTNDWNDVLPASGNEVLGYPTQKPLSLLERVIEVSSNPDELVLDPFCGCGTAVHAAEKLERQWIGIDITCLAIGLIERRLKDAFPGIQFEVHGTPKTLQDALDLAQRDKYQFQWWAVTLIDAQPYGGKKKGADRGIDGLLYFKTDKKTTERAIVSVKGGEHVGVGMVRELHSVMERENAPVGILICVGMPTRQMEAEAAAAGVYESEFGKAPRLQIITLAELFQGKRPRVPGLDPSAAFRKASREERKNQGELGM